MYRLDDPISIIKGIGNKKKGFLNEAGIYTINDLLNLFPKNYEVYEVKNPTPELDREYFVIEGFISSQIIVRKIRKSIDNIIFYFQTPTKNIKVVSYGRGYLRYSLKKGMFLRLYGQYKALDNSFSLKKIVSEQSPYVEPVYGIDGIFDKNITSYLNTLFLDAPIFDETLPLELVEKYRLIDINNYYRLIHFPNNRNDIKQVYRRKKYEAYFNYSIKMSSLSVLVKENSKTPKNGAKEIILEYIKTLPYELTNSQKEAINQVAIDSKKSNVMNRLVQGDVGSGKTQVAICAMLVNIKNNYQCIMMAPTELLARQHYETIDNALKGFKPSIVLMTSSTPSSKRADIIRGLENGSVDILITTQAALYHKIHYKNLGLLVIDEQHRFGVKDRQKILNEYPHTDAMYLSATPIPRTLGLVKFADMDISSMLERPSKRKRITTKLFNQNDLEFVYKDLEERLQRKEQAFCIGALIEGDAFLDLNTIKEMIENNVPSAVIGVIHGALKPEEKKSIMLDFVNKKYNVLVSTTVIEVGIDVKNATGIYIFNAERFGVSTLHQLRGRVGRNDLEAFCALISNDIDNERLKIIEKTDDCFELAEYDLKFRGPGEFLGEAQSGFIGLDFETDYNVYKYAKNDAEKYLDDYLTGKMITPFVKNLIEEMIDKKAKLN